jgi:hypothetical protein
LVVVTVAAIAALGWCRGQAAVGSSNNPDHGVIHVEVTPIKCESFTVQFETVSPVTEVSGTIALTSDISQTKTATYATPQTQHAITFTNLERDKWYSYSIMGRNSFDHPPGAQVVVPFSAETASCCINFPLR